MLENDSRLQSVKEISRLLSVSTFGLYRLIKAGKIPHYCFGRKILLNFREVCEALKTDNES